MENCNNQNERFFGKLEDVFGEKIISKPKFNQIPTEYFSMEKLENFILSTIESKFVELKVINEKKKSTQEYLKEIQYNLSSTLYIEKIVAYDKDMEENISKILFKKGSINDMGNRHDYEEYTFVSKPEELIASFPNKYKILLFKDRNNNTGIVREDYVKNGLFWKKTNLSENIPNEKISDEIINNFYNK